MPAAATTRATGRPDGQAQPQRAPQQQRLALGRRGLRDQDRQAGADAGEGDAADHLDHREELRPERHQFAAAAQREHLVDRRAAREADGDDRDRDEELCRQRTALLTAPIQDSRLSGSTCQAASGPNVAGHSGHLAAASSMTA